jgi:para-aminobenzoate synthetase / 4-amino-4-deoxychorismate lyase
VRVSLTPDPQRGVFETMLVLDGEPVELDAHLERLNTSLTMLYAVSLPDEARVMVLERARGVRLGKLRITAAPDVVDLVAHRATKSTTTAGKQLRLRIDTAELEESKVFPAFEHGAALRSLPLPGGLGDHKWADRRLLERAEAAARGELPLLLDADGSVLEASRGSVFATAENRLVTPPLDGRILPSIARLQALEAAREAGIEVHERPLALDELLRGEAFLAGSVRGVEPIRALDGVALPPPGAVSARVASGLQRRWLRTPAGEPAAAVAGGRPAGPRAH